MARRKTPVDLNLVVAYIRTSTGEQNLGLEAQRQAIETYASSRGLQVLSWHVEQVSGTKDQDKRPALSEALAAVRTRRAGGLLVLRRDRIARDVLIAGKVDQMLARAGAQLLCCDGSATDDSPQGRFTRTVLDAAAEMERGLIALRTKDALATLKRQGVHLGGYPYGWDRDGQAIAHEQAALLRMRQLAANGNSQPEICRVLTVEGHRPRGTQWNATTISRALRRAG